jgi:hypothetical protein
MDPVAIRTPVRTWFVVTSAFNGTATVHVHVIYLDIPFDEYERSRVGVPPDPRWREGECAGSRDDIGPPEGKPRRCPGFEPNV